MAQEQQIKQLSIALAQTQWEARTFISKEGQIQGKLEELRQEHSQRMYALRAERTSIMNELQEEMGSVKGGREFAEMREQHEQDVQAIGLRLRALQSYVETAEAELAVQVGYSGYSGYNGYSGYSGYQPDALPSAVAAAPRTRSRDDLDRGDRPLSRAHGRRLDGVGPLSGRPASSVKRAWLLGE